MIIQSRVHQAKIQYDIINIQSSRRGEIIDCSEWGARKLWVLSLIENDYKRTPYEDYIYTSPERL